MNTITLTNTRTGESVQFQSVAEASAQLGCHEQTVYRHLQGRSKRILREWQVPESDTRIVLRNPATQEVYAFNSKEEVAQAFGYTMRQVRYGLSRPGAGLTRHWDVVDPTGYAKDLYYGEYDRAGNFHTVWRRTEGMEFVPHPDTKHWFLAS